ncbi:MAG TPA: NAD(P)H-hydrate dehydratase [Candidatus Kapabacteria bacterium]|nr:NAD(P)H-hydrate dehydratase [Candidatus Kapabacteria bacterium]
MKPILTSDEMRSCDERSIKQFKIASLTLMENAARGAAKLLASCVKLRRKKVLVLCGKGNNGGDGLAVARFLKAQSANVTIGLAGTGKELHGDPQKNYRRAVKGRMKVIENISPEIVSAGAWDIIVDALLGTGSKLPLQKNLADLISAANESSAFKFSIDIPTGIDADSGAGDAVAFRADATATMAAVKRGLLFGEGKKHAGTIAVINIGTPPELLDIKNFSTLLLEESDVVHRLPRRELDANKYSVGKLFLLCGSRGMTGAAEMASKAAMRTGAGISILGIPESQQIVLATKLTETMTVAVPETDGSINDPALEKLGTYVQWGNAFVVGCGISKHEHTMETVRNFIRSLRAPCVLDADGIAAFIDHLDELKNATAPVILTPHYGELSKLIGMERAAIECDPAETAKNVARRLGCVLVLKGAPTVIAIPDGTVYINATGNPGMATAGSGDVLAGMIGALLAQNVVAVDAALCGVYMHGLAGDNAAEKYTRHAMIATDIIASIPKAYKEMGV